MCKGVKHVGVLNIVPPVNRNNTWENPDQPYIGSDEERKLYSLYFNQKCKEKCKENNFIFVDVYENYMDSNGYLRKDLSDDNVHIRDGTFLKEFVTSHFTCE